MANVVIFFLGFILAVVIGQFLKVNPGFIAIFFGLLINWFVVGEKSNVFISFWPTTLFWNLVVMMMFYGFANSNGTMKLFGKKVVYTFRNAKWAIVIVIFLATVLLSASGASLTASLIMAPLAWELCMQAGVTPLLIPFTTWAGEVVLGFLPWTVYGSINMGYFAQYFPQVDGAALLGKYNLHMLWFFTLAFVVVFIICKGWKVRENSATMEMPEKFNSVQIRTLIIIGATILLLLIPTVLGQFVASPPIKWMKGNLSMPVLGAIGISVLCLTRCGDLREVCSKNVGWYAVWTVTGMAMYCGLAQGLGVIETLGNGLQTMPSGVIAVAIYLVAAVLTFFVTPNAFQPFLFAMVPALAVAAGCSIPAIAIPVMMGCATTCFSPFTASGINNLIGAPQELQAAVINKMSLVAIAMGAAGLVLTALGVFAL